MNRSDFTEIHYITLIANVPSILGLGILSHRKAATVSHVSVAMQEIQDIRKDKPVPPGNRTIHDFANLYFHARNPMMFKRASLHHLLCVLRVSPGVLDRAGVVLTDQNAASKYVRFLESPAGLALLDRDGIFAPSWSDEDQIQYWRKKSVKCAEILVPDLVPASFIMGAYVSCEPAGERLRLLAPAMTIALAPDLFFQPG